MVLAIRHHSQQQSHRWQRPLRFLLSLETSSFRAYGSLIPTSIHIRHEVNPLGYMTPPWCYVPFPLFRTRDAASSSNMKPREPEIAKECGLRLSSEQLGEELRAGHRLRQLVGAEDVAATPCVGVFCGCLWGFEGRERPAGRRDGRQPRRRDQTRQI